MEKKSSAKKRKELFIGQKAEFEKTISECDVYLFAGITGDMNPLHINAVMAASSFAKERIVHGALLNGMISTVIGMKLPGFGTIYMEQNSKYLMPVYIGDTVRAIVKVEEILNVKKNILKLETVIVNQKKELVLKGYAIVKAPMENIDYEGGRDEKDK